MPNLNWIVPCRRAVITGRVDYESVLDEWARELEQHRETISRWYEVNLETYDDVLETALRGWIDYFWGHRFDIPICLDDPNTLDLLDYNFYVRLWKGPLRVLLEAGSQIAQLQLNEKKEVTNTDTVFLTGDVIEFPIFTFLLLCNKDEFNNTEFDPEGSFLLGTSLRNLPNPTAIHDNRLGMKFQHLLNFAVGTFYHLGGVRGVGFGREADGHTFSSRGMIYGGSLGNPVAENLTDGDSHWVIIDNSWGDGSAGPLRHPYNLPAPGSIPAPARGRPGWPNDYLLTSAWACSPCTLFLTHFMFDIWIDYGSNNVHTTMCNSSYPLQEYFIKRYDRIKPPMIAMPSNPRQIVERAAISVFSLTGHEKATVKIYASSKLLRERSLPFRGFLSAYDPLDGQGCTDTEMGQLYFFEATGSLGRWEYLNDVPGTRPDESQIYSVFGVRSFNWQPVNPGDNLFPSGLVAFFTNGDNALEHAGIQTNNLRPIVIFGYNRRKVVENYQELYSNRAVPFPTMAEAAGKFPTIGSVRPRITAAINALATRPPGAPPPDNPPSVTYTDLLGGTYVP